MPSKRTTGKSQKTARSISEAVGSYVKLKPGDLGKEVGNTFEIGASFFGDAV